MANSKDRGAAHQTASAGVAQERTQHAVDEWTRGVQEGLTRYQEMFSQLPGFGTNGTEAIGRRGAFHQLRGRSDTSKNRICGLIEAGERAGCARLCGETVGRLWFCGRYELERFQLAIRAVPAGS